MKKKARQDPLARRAQILEAAARIFCEKGFEGASMGDISAALGITKAGIYHHIRSKEDLLYAIMSYGMDLFENKVLRRVAAIRDPLERLKATLKGHILVVTRDRPKEITVILHESSALRGRSRARIDARKRRYVRFLERTLRDLVRRGAARRVDPTVAAFAMLGMVNWIYQWYRPAGRLSQSELADALSDVFLRGILKPGAAARAAG